MRPDKQAAKDAGIPTWLRRYSRQYGRGIFDLLQKHKQNSTPTLDHGRDRALAKLAAPLEPRAVIEGVVHVS